MDNVKLTRREQKGLRVISKIISIVSKIVKIFAIIDVFFIALALIVVPVIISHIEVKNNEISWVDDSNRFTVHNEKNRLQVKYNNKVVADINGGINFDNYDLVKKGTKRTLIMSAEGSLLLILFEVIFLIVIISNVEKLFRNISQEDTPFTLENVIRVRRIACFMVFAMVFSSLSQISLAALFNGEISEIENPFNLFELLVVFVGMYLFKYGYELQQDSEYKVYGEVKEKKKIKTKK